jgi:crooked neck
VWISYAKFEASAMKEDGGGLDLAEENVHEQKKHCIQRARSREFWKNLFLTFIIYYMIVFEFHHHLHSSFVFHESGVFEKAINYFRTSAPELQEERAMLLEEWLNMEGSFGKLGDVSLVQSKLPKKLKKRRQILAEDGPAGYVSPTLNLSS